MRTVRASEISAYLYCRRAWWYGRQGYESENQAALGAGRSLHAAHGRQVLVSGLQRLMAYLLLIAALVLLTAYLTTLFL
jgi:CRISPR/Cas system-associated exonuclease Cas4 (RecB family)